MKKRNKVVVISTEDSNGAQVEEDAKITHAAEDSNRTHITVRVGNLAGRANQPAACARQPTMVQRFTTKMHNRWDVFIS